MAWTSFAGEAILGLVLLVFGWAFRNWAEAIKHSSRNILDRIERLGKDFADHRLKNEARMTKVETEMSAIHKRLDDCKISSLNSRSKDD